MFVIISLLSMFPSVMAWQGKSTIASSDPLGGLAFSLKYLPVTVAEDNGDGDINPHWGTQVWVQGRSSALLNGSYTERNCQLFSSKGQLASATKYQSMASNGLGKDCSYSNGTKYTSGTELHAVFAYNRKQCCNACVATDGCIAATFLTSDNDKSGMGPSPLEHNWEGFAIHMADVTANTTGGIPVEQLESHFHERLGDFSAYDQFMDYRVTFFTHDLQPYYGAFVRDGVPCFLAQWVEEHTGKTWYSLFFLVHSSFYIIELTSTVKPDVGYTRLPQIEQRMSHLLTNKFSSYPAHPAHIMWIASINRATSNMTSIIDVYTNLFKATLTYEVNDKDVVRRCYKMDEQNSTDDLWNHVCFSSRTPDAEKDKIFSVLDFEQMLWAEHAGTLGNDPTSQVDKYTDNHNGLRMNPEGIQALEQRFDLKDPYPITNDTRLAYLCKQSYIIDPTGWSIMPVSGASWPGCFDKVTLV
jgi:hypothetical protein